MLVGGLFAVFALWYFPTQDIGSRTGELVETVGWPALVLFGVLVAGAVMIIFGILELRRTSVALRDGQATTAEVIHRYERTVGSGDNKSSEFHLELVLPDGHHQKLRVGSSVYYSAQKGDQIEVIYLPGDENSVLIAHGLSHATGLGRPLYPATALRSIGRLIYMFLGGRRYRFV